jgi:hypothetical protein
MRLRQIALVARELEKVVDDVAGVLGLEVCYRDPGVEEFGLHNALFAIDDCFLEIVSPLRAGTTAGRLLEKRHGDGGYMVIVQTDDLDADRARMKALGVRIVWQAELRDAATIHLHPRDVGGAIVSLDRMTPPESWRWAGPEWREHVRTEVTRELRGVEIQAADPAATAERWSQVLARPARDRGDGEREIALERGCVRFVADRDGRGEGVAGIDVAVADRMEVLHRARARGLSAGAEIVEIGGVRFRLEQA